MNFLNTHDLLISTLSPVHIGCGEDYEPTNYVINNGTLDAFDPVQLLDALPPAERAELIRAQSNRDPVLATQRFFFRHKERIAQIALHRAPVAQAAADFYTQRIGKIANAQRDGTRIINTLEIARTAFDPLSGSPILPGSSIKGAIRTALLDSLRHQTGRRYSMTDQEASRNRLSSGKAKAMEVDLMKGSFASDPMRLVKLADAAFCPGGYLVRNAKGEELKRERQSRAILFQVNRKKRPNQFTAGGKIETLVECIPEGQPKAFSGQLVIERKAAIGKDSPQLQFDFSAIAAACNDFYRDRLERDLMMLDGNGYVSSVWAKKARDRLAPTGIWGKVIGEKRGFLLRLGRHSGAESVTIDAPRKIKIMKGRDASPEWREEATTVWLAAIEKGAATGMWPFGWVFVQAHS